MMIAAGVGITPIYSIIKELSRRNDSPPVTLIYSVHHETDILYREEIDGWFEKFSNWKLHYICTSQPDWPGEKGRLTPDRILSLCGDSKNGSFFLCGPLGLVKAIERHLRSQGVPRRKIKREQFVFLP